MSGRGTETDLVTGAFSYSGSRIAEVLIESGREVRTLTHHPDREHPLRARVQAQPYRFDDPVALKRSLEGISTLYNTYWVRFERSGTTYAKAVANSRALFEAARRAGVARVVHLSIANPSVDSPLPYYRGKALVEQALTAADVPCSIVRPTWIFGGRREFWPTTSHGSCGGCRSFSCRAMAATWCSRSTLTTLRTFASAPRTVPAM